MKSAVEISQFGILIICNAGIKKLTQGVSFLIRKLHLRVYNTGVKPLYIRAIPLIASYTR